MPRILYPTCLIFSTWEDVYVQPIMERMSAASIPFLCDYTRFGIDYTATITEDLRVILTMFDGTQVCFDQVQTIWWRRPGSFPFQRINDITVTRYIHRDNTQFWESVLAILECNPAIEWYNPIDPQYAAGRRAFQKIKAKEVGLMVTEGIVTSTQHDARTFVSEDPATIFKMATTWMGDTMYWQPTRLWKDEMLPALDTLYLCPTIFQRYLAGHYDYRVTVINDQIQAARYDLRTSEYPFDVRMDVRTKVEACTLDASMERKILALMQSLGLRYGALDFREDQDGTLVFLEINPAGGFMHIDDMAGTDIAGMMARALSGLGQGGSDALVVAPPEYHGHAETLPTVFEYSSEQQSFAERLGKPMDVMF